MSDEKVLHSGGCHCGAVRFEVKASDVLEVVHCDCSICEKKQNHHFIVPKDDFAITKGEENLTTYTFNTHAAKHMFCKLCGVQSFYVPRSNPDGYGVMPHCLDKGTVRRIITENFLGSNWEESIKTDTLSKRSKPDGYCD